MRRGRQEGAGEAERSGAGGANWLGAAACACAALRSGRGSARTRFTASALAVWRLMSSVARFSSAVAAVAVVLRDERARDLRCPMRCIARSFCSSLCAGQGHGTRASRVSGAGERARRRNFAESAMLPFSRGERDIGTETPETSADSQSPRLLLFCRWQFPEALWPRRRRRGPRWHGGRRHDRRRAGSWYERPERERDAWKRPAREPILPEASPDASCLGVRRSRRSSPVRKLCWLDVPPSRGGRCHGDWRVTFTRPRCSSFPEAPGAAQYRPETSHAPCCCGGVPSCRALQNSSQQGSSSAAFLCSARPRPLSAPPSGVVSADSRVPLAGGLLLLSHDADEHDRRKRTTTFVQQQTNVVVKTTTQQPPRLPDPAAAAQRPP